MTVHNAHESLKLQCYIQKLQGIRDFLKAAGESAVAGHCGGSLVINRYWQSERSL